MQGRNRVRGHPGNCPSWNFQKYFYVLGTTSSYNHFNLPTKASGRCAPVSVLSLHRIVFVNKMMVCSLMLFMIISIWWFLKIYGINVHAVFCRFMKLTVNVFTSNFGVMVFCLSILKRTDSRHVRSSVDELNKDLFFLICNAIIKFCLT